MRKLFAGSGLAVLIVMLTIGFTSTASAASCSAAGVGGEKAPTVDTTAGTVSESGEQGYKCTVAWKAALTVEYESAGTWHTATEVAPQFHPASGLITANSVFEWPLQNRIFTEPLYQWTPAATYDTPVCAFNWRIHLDFFNSGGSNFQSNNSPQTNKTC